MSKENNNDASKPFHLHIMIDEKMNNEINRICEGGSKSRILRAIIQNFIDCNKRAEEKAKDGVTQLINEVLVVNKPQDKE